MPKYRYTLTAEVEVDAPNAVLADIAVRRPGFRGTGLLVRAIGSHCGTVRGPSQRREEPSQMAVVRVGGSALKRMR